MHDPFVFIVGSPRSGTTVLGEILDRHESISQWYEPYFIWDHHFRLAAHDERTAEDATPAVAHQIASDFYDYHRKSNCRFVVDKSPRNSLKIPFIRKIFPQARFIHIIRDGRDTTLSIHKEWRRRQNVVRGGGDGDRFQYAKAFRVVIDWLGRQKFFKHKIRALWFETRLHLLDKSRHLNRLRWNGQIGWGPRVSGWQETYAAASLLQFNAHQWTKCVERIVAAWPDVDEKRKLEIRYESLITDPQATIEQMASFLKLQTSKDFYRRIPKLKSNNFNKWKRQLDRRQLAEIKDIVTPMLLHYGYERTGDWLSK